MAPKKRTCEATPALPEAKAKASAKRAKTKAAASQPRNVQDPALMANLASSPCGASTQAMTLNGSVWSKHLENVRIFKAQASSQDAVQLPPDARNFGQVFDSKTALESLKREGKYLCLMNALWLDQTWSATPQIPISQGAVDQVRSH